MPVGFRLVVGMIISLIVSACSMATPVLKEEGLYPSPRKMCTAVLDISPQGGFLQLSVQAEKGKLVHMADDITGFLWVGESTLVFSSSPIYGRPGVFEVTCGRDQPSMKILVSPKNISTAYPDGADYFEINKVEGLTIHFFYGDDVDDIDFNEFRTEKYLRTVVLSQPE